MAALSDYLESQLLNHIFRDSTFDKPSNISIALCSGVPLDSDTGSTLPELPSGIGGLDTRYRRYSLNEPSDSSWNKVGVDDETAYAVFVDPPVGSQSGYYFPLYLKKSKAEQESSNGLSNTVSFDEFPGVLLYAPASEQQMGVDANPGYDLYEGNGFIKNTSQIVFNAANTDWGWVSGVAVVDSDVYGSGNMLMYSALTNPRYVYTGDNIKFDVLSLEICLK